MFITSSETGGLREVGILGTLAEFNFVFFNPLRGCGGVGFLEGPQLDWG